MAIHLSEFETFPEIVQNCLISDLTRVQKQNVCQYLLVVEYLSTSVFWKSPRHDDEI